MATGNRSSCCRWPPLFASSEASCWPSSVRTSRDVCFFFGGMIGMLPFIHLAQRKSQQASDIKLGMFPCFFCGEQVDPEAAGHGVMEIYVTNKHGANEEPDIGTVFRSRNMHRGSGTRSNRTVVRPKPPVRLSLTTRKLLCAVNSEYVRQMRTEAAPTTAEANQRL